MGLSPRAALGALAVLLACACSTKAQDQSIPGYTPPVLQVKILPQTIEDLALQSQIELQCVKEANPDKAQLAPGDTVLVPLDCCEVTGSCAAPFCTQRDACDAKPGLGMIPFPQGSTTITGTVFATDSPDAPVIVPPPVVTGQNPPPGPVETPENPPNNNNNDPVPIPLPIPLPNPIPNPNPPNPNPNPPNPNPNPPNPNPNPPNPNPNPPNPNPNPPNPNPNPPNPNPNPPNPNPNPPNPQPEPEPEPKPNPEPAPVPEGDPPPPQCTPRPSGTPRLKNRQNQQQNPPECKDEGEDEEESNGRPYLISTKPGTSRAAFEAFLLLPPLAGKKGSMIAYEGVPWQSWQTLDLSDTDAAIVRANPIIDFAEPIQEDEDGAFRAIPRADDIGFTKRALPQELLVRDPSDWHLGLLTARNQRRNPTVLPNYVFQPSLGKGQTIYVLDSGLKTSHEDFAADDREVATFVVPNLYTLGGIRDTLRNAPLRDEDMAPEDITDITGHGTAVASVAVGKVRGVASKANLVAVKFRNSIKNPLNPGSNRLVPRGLTDSAIDVSLQFVLSDIKRRKSEANDQSAKFIINISGGWPRFREDAGVRRPSAKAKTFEKFMEELKKVDAVVVLAAGNDGRSLSLDQIVPQALGTDDNHIITVGGVDKEGKYYLDTINKKGNLAGSLSLYAGAVDVTVAKHDGDDSATKTETGTSFAAPAVAGLAAYFFAIPELRDNFKAGSIGNDVKQFMIKNSEQRNDDPIPEGSTFGASPKPDPASIKVPYNLALNDLCDLQAPAKRAMLFARAEKPVVQEGKVVDETLKKPLCDTAAFTPGGNNDSPGGDQQGKPDPNPDSPDNNNPPPPPPPGTKPPPSPPNLTFEVGTFSSDPKGPTKWAVFSRAPDASLDMCSDSTQPTKEGDDAPTGLAFFNMKDPVKVGPFDINDDYKLCNFIAYDPNGGGNIECIDRDAIPCPRVEGSKIESCLKGREASFSPIWVCAAA